MKKLTLLTTVFLLLVACNQTPKSYKIEGILPDTSHDGEKVYLLEFYEDKYIDSTIVSGCEFLFEGVIDTPTQCRIDVGRQFASFYLENEVYEIDFETQRANSLSKLNTALNNYRFEFEELGNSIGADIEKIKMQTDDPMEQMKLQEEAFQNIYRQELLEFLKSNFKVNSNNQIGVDILLTYSSYATPEEMDELIAQAGKSVLSCGAIQKMIERNDALKNTKEGKLFVDFSIKQEDGAFVSLSDFVGKGKYVLVDFWASWCSPCIQEIPVLKEVYSKYKGDKFDVLGVAVWDELSKSKQTVEKYNMNWPQILNASTIPMDMYGVRGIPYIILFAPDGTIIARGLRGEKLKAKVEEVLLIQ